MRLQCVALISLVAGLAQAQRLSPEFFIDDPVVGPAGGVQDFPAVAWVGTGFFVVWSDTRDGQSVDLWFRRFNANGAPLTGVSAPLLRGPGAQGAPSISFGNGSVLVTWLDDASCNAEVMAQVFTLSGAPTGTALRLSMGNCTRERPSVAFDAPSARWLVAWAGDGAGHVVKGALIAADGTLAVSAFDLAISPNSTRAAWVNSLTSGFLVSWADDRLVINTPQVFVAPVSALGLTGAAVQVAASAASQPRSCLAPFGTGALAVWAEGSSVSARALTSTGSVLGNTLLVAATPGVVSDVACSPGPLGSVVVSWVDARTVGGTGVYFATISPASVPSAEVAALPKFSYFERDSARVAVSDAVALVVARGPAGYVTDSDVLGRVLPLGGASDAGVFIVATGGSPLSHVNAAFAGDRYLAVWRDDGQSAGGSDTFGQLLEVSTGRKLVDGGVRVTFDSGNLVSYPSVSASAAGFFVSWGDDGSAGQVAGASVSPLGVVGPRLLLSDTSSYVNTHVSRWWGQSWATVFLKDGAVRGRRTLATGATLQAESPLATSAIRATTQLDAAPLGDALLSVFTTADGGLDVWGTLQGDDGGVTAFPITNAAGADVDPAINAGASVFLVAWSHLGTILATRVSRQGGVLDVPPLTLGPGTTPSVGWTGAEFVIVWRRDADVIAARVNEQGLAIDAVPFVIAAGAELELAPHAASGPGESLLSWQVFDPSWGSFRLRGRFLSAGNLAAPDGGVTDAGVADAGVADAGVTDAGAADAGGTPEEMDAGAVFRSDAGEWGPVRTLSVGCGCSEASVSPLWLAFSLLWLRGTRRRPARAS